MVDKPISPVLDHFQVDWQEVVNNPLGCVCYKHY